jgi:shikimate kinase
MNIYLVGMIGAGKTAVGKVLAARMGWKFDDLDLAMERSAGKDFRKVVEEEGWLGFRQREYAICKQYAQEDQVVVGLGGGTVRYDWNCDVLKGTGIRILLVADLAVLANRVRINDRPRVNPNSTLEEDLAKIWENHKELYYNFADIVCRTDQGKSVEEEVNEILEILQRDYGLRGI